MVRSKTFVGVNQARLLDFGPGTSRTHCLNSHPVTSQEFEIMRIVGANGVVIQIIA